MKDLNLAAELCYSYMQTPNSFVYEKLLHTCRKIGRHFLKLAKLIPPTHRKMVDAQFDGGGMINVNRTITSFCTHGRQLDEIVERKRSLATRKMNLFFVYDNSNSMTAWWRTEYLHKKIMETNSPQTAAKISTISLLESFAKEADVDMIFYGSKIEGPYMGREYSLKEFIKKNGAGGSRLDLALKKIVEMEWYKKGGKKYLIILTDGVPETGKENYKKDSQVQDKVIQYLKTLIDFETKILYIPIISETKLAYKQIGNYTAVSFAESLAKMGITVKPVKRIPEMVENLFDGVKELVTKIR